MINQHLISVIVPIYNMEKYIEKCLDSILAQTYKNLEIILVNDGSTDNSSIICNDYAKKDNRIKVIHQENRGVCSARNKGLDVAKGEYIAFVDPDDYLLPDMYRSLLEIIQKEKGDIAVCNTQYICSDRTVIEWKFPTDVNLIYSEYTDWLKDFVVYGNLQVVWNKLFNRKILEGHYFDTNLVRAEDVNFLLDITKYKCRIVLYPQVFYCYVMRKNSAVRQYKIKYFESEYLVWKRLFEISESLLHDKNNLMTVYQKVAERACKLSLLIALLDQENQYKVRLEELKHFFKMNLHKREFISKRIVRTWTYLFGKYPNLIIRMLRLLLIKRIFLYYLKYRR